MRHATASLACDHETSRHAQEFVRTILDLWNLDPAVIDDAQLLVGELVTNAVLHGECERTEVTVTLHRMLVIGVADSAPPLTLPGKLALTTTGGWGLHLVDSIADNWGVTATQHGKIVWFELLATHRTSSQSRPRTTRHGSAD